MSDSVSPACPRCSSTESVPRNPSFFAILGVCIIAFGIANIFFIPPLGIGSIVLGIVVLAFSPFAKNFRQCRKCRKIWKAKI